MASYDATDMTDEILAEVTKLPQGVEALYLALTETTALAEYNQSFTHRPQPKTLCAYDVNCKDILDLTDVDQRQSVGITQSELACGWKMILKNKKTPPTWMMVTSLIKDGISGIIVPSYAPNAPEGGQNIVLWRWDSDLPHKVTVIDDHNTLS